MAKPPTSDPATRAILGDRELARRFAMGMGWRTEPLRVRWDLDEVTSSDGHRIRCTFGAAVQVNDRPADRKMLEEALLASRDAVSADDVMRHFEPALRGAWARAAARHPVGDLIAEDGAAKQEALEALRSAANAVAFASGVDVLPPFHLELHSGTFDRERMEAMQRRLAERRAAGQVEHVQRAADLLKHFRSLRDAAPELSVGRLLERVSTPDRGTMLEALLLASADGRDAPPLWAVAGPALVRIDSIESAPPRVEVVELTTALGPLRSVSGATVDGDRALLVGARAGVMIVDPHDPAAARTYAALETGSPLGFNSVAAWDGKLFATHRDIGLVAWSIDRPGQGAEVVADKDLANLRVIGERLVYSRGGELRGRTRGGAEIEPIALGPEPVVGIVPRGEGCIIVSASGEVVALDVGASGDGSPRPPQRRCGRVRSAAALPWLGDVRLLLATDEGPVCCVGVDDSLVTQYVSPHRALKALAATNGLVAGVTGDRQRIVLWHSWDGKRPVAELHVGAQTKHRVADLCFA